MAPLATTRQFLDHLRVDRGLRIDEAPKVERIAHALLLSRTALSAVPDSP
jgi:hypothetical protein